MPGGSDPGVLELTLTALTPTATLTSAAGLPSTATTSGRIAVPSAPADGDRHPDLGPVAQRFVVVLDALGALAPIPFR